MEDFENSARNFRENFEEVLRKFWKKSGKFWVNLKSWERFLIGNLEIDLDPVGEDRSKIEGRWWSGVLLFLLIHVCNSGSSGIYMFFWRGGGNKYGGFDLVYLFGRMIEL